jgi:2-isopropylmalate synthase
MMTLLGEIVMSSFNAQKYQSVAGVKLENRQWPNRMLTKAPIWCSVDLRDGNQALPEPMTVEQKKQLWQLLVRMGFKEIEVAFPSASQPDYDFVRWLIEENQIPDDVRIQVLVQARESLIARTFEALAGVKRANVHVYNSVSPTQRDWVFGLDKAQVQDLAVQGARWLQDYAQRYPQTDWRFQYSPESFSQTEPDYALSVCNAVLAVWQPTKDNPVVINLPSTVQVASPNVFADQIEYMSTRLTYRDAVILSVHTHNDRGCGVAEAELAMLAGAQRVEGTLLGNGERTGNCDITTMAMNLYSQGIDPMLDLSNPDELVRVVKACTKMELHPRHPWLGELVYTAFSGSHQDAIGKCLRRQSANSPWQVAYLPIDPKDIGRSYEAVVRVNSQSGKGGTAFVLERDYGLRLPKWLQPALAKEVQRLSEQQATEVSSQQIYALFQMHYLSEVAGWKLTAYTVDNVLGMDKLAVTLDDGRAFSGQGAGTIEALVNALAMDVRVLDYQEHALTQGTKSQAIAYVQLQVQNKVVFGVAISDDTVCASLQAVLTALGRG